MAVQGGLLASVIASREESDLDEGSKRKHTVWPVVVFIVFKLFAYVLLGFALGAFGSLFALSDRAVALIQALAGMYMIAIALNLLDVHPIFRYAVIQPPRFLFKLIRNQSKSKDLFAPALLGAMTIFIPCGTTLAMEALAISTGSPLKGGLIMGTFVLGTAPLFFGLGFLTTLLGDTFKKNFLKVAAFIVMYLGVISVNNSLIAVGSNITLQSLAENFPVRINIGETSGSSGNIDAVVDDQGIQNATITVLPDGYSPNYMRVKQGIPLRLTIKSSGVYSCALGFRIPSLRIAKNLAANDTKVVEFTPAKTGKIPFSCSMGMYRGTIEVI